MSDSSAFVLAGGKSSRMGSDKAFLQLDGRTLLARALELAQAAAPQVFIVGQRDKFACFGAVVEDVFPGRGPLGGIHAALSATATELNLVLAVDLPFMRADFLRYLLERARASSALVVVPRALGGYQPLCAVYRRAFRQRAETVLQAGRNKIDPLFTPGETLVLEQEELERLSFPAAMFDNLNTRQEYERAKSGMQQGR